MYTVDGGLSAIIRCRDEERWVGHAIQSVLDYHPDAEIIVVDDDSQDNSRRIINMFSPFRNLKVLSQENYSPGSAINQGVDNALHENILILSAHCQLTSRVPVEYLQPFCAVWGKQTPVYLGKKITPRYIWKNFGPESKINYVAPGEGRYFLHNALAMYKRDTLIENPFNEDLMGKEDRYWAKEMIDTHKKRILYHPALSCLHHWTEHGATWQDE